MCTTCVTKRNINAAKWLLEELESGSSVPLSSIFKVLDEPSYQLLKDDIENFKSLGTICNSLPDYLKKYLKQVKIADMQYGRAKSLSQERKHFGAALLFQKAENGYENAIALLKEFAQHTDVGLYMDRELGCFSDDYIAPNPAEIPRLMCSRSHLLRDQK